MDMTLARLQERAALPRHKLGRTDLDVTKLCVGGGPLGSVPHLFGHDTPAEAGIQTAIGALTGPTNFLDTGNSYSNGESERRVGEALTRLGGLPEGRVLATKLDRDLKTGEFTGDRMWRSLEESFNRLGVESVQVLHLHDPEHIGFDVAMKKNGPFAALAEMKRQGLAKHIGVAGGPISMLLDFVRTDLFDVVLTHNRYTLVDRSAEPLLDEAAARNVAVLNGAVFGGGVLATTPKKDVTYAYRQASPGMAAAIHRAADIARRYDVQLGALALQFSTRDPRIASTVVGVSSPARIADTLDNFEVQIPDEAWEEIQGVAAPRSDWLG